MYLMSAPAMKARSPEPVRTARAPAAGREGASASRGRARSSRRAGSRSRPRPDLRDRPRSADWDFLAQELDDLGHRGAGCEDLGDALPLELLRVLARDRPAH